VKHPAIAALVLAWGAVTLTAPAPTPHMPVAEIRPGMVGVGKTAFQGTAIEEFQAHILGVLHSNVGPRRDLVLARLEGGPLANTGVIAGMSGSPVYVGGRLIGAVSYSLGAFATEALAGITPIGEIVEAARSGLAGPAAVPPPVPVGSDLATLMSVVERALERARDQAGAPWALPPSGRGLPGAASLQPIALPLTLGGLGKQAAEAVSGPLRAAGFLPPVQAPGGLPAASGAPLQPGEPVGVALITGDLQLGATGTVTEVDGQRVYAFGHAMYNLGPACFAMTRAYVHAVLPSLSQSMKIASVGETIGTIQQDRATTVAGLTGVRPDMVGMTVSLRRDGGPARRFSFELGDHPLLTPLLAYTALTGIIVEHEHDIGHATYRVRARIAIDGHAPVEIDDVHAGEQPGAAAASAVAVPLSSLLTNGRDPVRVRAISVDIDSAERLRAATIDRIWLAAPEPRRGQTVPLKILLTPWRGEPAVRTVEIEIPRHAEGPLTLVVADGVSFAQWEQRERRAALAPSTLDQLIKALNQARRGNRVYVRLAGRDAGAIVNGEILPSLPGSVLAVMQSDRGADAASALQTSVLGTWEISTDEAVRGIRTITIPLAPPVPVP